MWQLTVNGLELFLRAALAYGFIVILLRISGKRQIGQLTLTDFVLLLLLSNAVQNAMNGGDNSALGGLILASTLILINIIVTALNRRFKAVEQWVEGAPVILIHNGKLYLHQLETAHITLHELHAALRLNGCENLAAVHIAVLEVNGAISVIKKQGTTPHLNT